MINLLNLDLVTTQRMQFIIFSASPMDHVPIREYKKL